MKRRVDLKEFSLDYHDQIQHRIDHCKTEPDIQSLPFPRYITLELTNKCNLKCIYCQRLKYSRSLLDMDFDFFRTLIHEIEKQPVASLSLNYSGEIFIYPHLEAVFKTIAEAGIHSVGFTTNATIWNEEAYRIFLSESDGSLSISMDTDLDSIHEVRPGVTKSLLMKNFDKIFTLKSKLNSRVKIDVNSVLHTSQIDIDKIQQFADHWLDCADSLTMTLCTNDDIHLINADNDFLPVSGLGTKEICGDPFHYMAILADGQINLCCNNISCRNLYRDLNVATQSIADIWNSSTYGRIRALLSECRYEQLPICRNCDLWYRHYFNFSQNQHHWNAQFNGYKLYISKNRTLFHRVKYRFNRFF